MKLLPRKLTTSGLLAQKVTSDELTTAENNDIDVRTALNKQPFAPLSLCFEKVFRSQMKMICEVPPVGLEVMYPSSSSPSPPPSSRVSIGAALHTPDIPLGGGGVGRALDSV